MSRRHRLFERASADPCLRGPCSPGWLKRGSTESPHTAARNLTKVFKHPPPIFAPVLSHRLHDQPTRNLTQVTEQCQAVRIGEFGLMESRNLDALPGARPHEHDFVFPVTVVIGVDVDTVSFAVTTLHLEAHPRMKGDRSLVNRARDARPRNARILLLVRFQGAEKPLFWRVTKSGILESLVGTREWPQKGSDLLRGLNFQPGQ